MSPDLLAPLVRKLNGLDLAAEEKDALLGAVTGVRRFAARQTVFDVGDNPADVYVLLEGLVARHKALPDGSRQVVSFKIPGDFCESAVLVSRFVEHTVTAITNCVFAVLPKRDLRTLVEGRSGLALALWADHVADAAIDREWVLNLGRRSAPARLAHLLCEMGARLSAAGLGAEDRFTFPVTQADLGDALGLSTVHVNRSLQQLRGMGLISFKNQIVDIHRLEPLREVAYFDPAYLQV